MNSNFAKYILVFLAAMYLLGCVVEIAMVKNGAEFVFQSIEKLVPHISMFLLGTMFTRER